VCGYVIRQGGCAKTVDGCVEMLWRDVCICYVDIDSVQRLSESDAMLCLRNSKLEDGNARVRFDCNAMLLYGRRDTLGRGSLTLSVGHSRPENDVNDAWVKIESFSACLSSSTCNFGVTPSSISAALSRP
jgi:hypothetical protein